MRPVAPETSVNDVPSVECCHLYVPLAACDHVPGVPVIDAPITPVEGTVGNAEFDGAAMPALAPLPATVDASLSVPSQLDPPPPPPLSPPAPPP